AGPASPVQAPRSQSGIANASGERIGPSDQAAAGFSSGTSDFAGARPAWVAFGIAVRRIPGNTSKVSAVEATMPAITTVASGRCPSAPAPVAIAIGMKPNAATAAVVNTARRLWIVPPSTASSGEAPSVNCRNTSDVTTTPFSTETPASAMKPTAAG